MESDERLPAAPVPAEEFAWPPPASEDDIVALDWRLEGTLQAGRPEPSAPIPPERTESDGAGRSSFLAEKPEKIEFDRHDAVAIAQPVAKQPAPSPISVSRDLETVALKLSTILAVEIEFEWHDAVAIVQQLADQIIGDRARGSVPAADRILIEPTGRLRFSLDAAARESQTRGLGYLLNQLLNGRSAPPALRLLASQTVADGSEIASTADLMKLLAQFERPKRQEKLAELYFRALRARASSPAAAPVTEISRAHSKAPVTELQSAPQSAPTTIRTHAWRRRAAVAVLAIAIAGAVTMAVSRAGRFFNSIPAEPAPKAAADSGNQVFELEDSERPAATNRSAAKSPAPAGRSVSPRPNPGAASQLQDSQATAGTAASAALEQPSAEPPVSRGSVPLAVAPAPSSAVSNRNAAVDRGVDDRIYSAADAGVIEPVLTRPYLPPLPPGVTPDELGVLEVVVDADGKVESVRLRSGPDAYRDFWWASVAKNWRFRPALKDGRPVKFLKRLSITDFPIFAQPPVPDLER